MELEYRDKLRQVGLNINYYRRYRKLTQMQLAEKVHISPCYVSQIERGLVKKCGFIAGTHHHRRCFTYRAGRPFQV
ncbi:MAG: helix-turn-helix transcriptional regulator [Veillonellales bacterium]